MPKIHVEELAGWHMLVVPGLGIQLQEDLWGQLVYQAGASGLETSFQQLGGSWGATKAILHTHMHVRAWLHMCMYMHTHAKETIYTHKIIIFTVPNHLNSVSSTLFFQSEELRLVFILVQIYWDSFSQILILWSFPPPILKTIRWHQQDSLVGMGACHQH